MIKIFNDRILYWVSLRQNWVVGITIFPFIISKEKMRKDEKHINHEKIHIWQQAECLLFLFPIIYYGHYAWNRFIMKRNHMMAYKSICFEREAYANANNFDYLESRKPWSWLRYF